MPHLNAVIGSDGEGATQWQDWLEDEDADQASDYCREGRVDQQRMELDGKRRWPCSMTVNAIFSRSVGFRTRR